jgi:hypothetical protein
MAGCGGSSPPAGGGGLGAGTLDSGTSDLALCDSACAAFFACGTTVAATCSGDCVGSSAAYRSCLRTAGTNCNALAMCLFTALAPVDCPGGGGIPAGTATCAVAADCEGTCNAGSAPESCTCACITAMSPAVAIDLVNNNSCAAVDCASDCNAVAGSGPACNTCFDAACAGPRADCMAN